jgi:hypothetical protein
LDSVEVDAMKPAWRTDVALGISKLGFRGDGCKNHATKPAWRIDVAEYQSLDSKAWNLP